MCVHSFSLPLLSVHPRVGGEHPASVTLESGPSGSSPRGRGTLSFGKSLTLTLRFIPAWAGNIHADIPRSTTQSVHPRVGGEHASARVKTLTACGSSPRGRGTLNLGSAAHSVIRFIPAWAGNITDDPYRAARTPVHPRVGGEHRSSAKLITSSYGSSPRGRGTYQRPELPVCRCRFIPAWAGNISPSSFVYLKDPVHPRVGGEHEIFSPVWTSSNGSSPRGRGTS